MSTATVAPRVPLSDEGELLLRRTIAVMKQNLSNWDQNNWFSNEAGGQPACKTTACLAGWIVAVGKYQKTPMALDFKKTHETRLDWPATAMTLLGIDRHSRAYSDFRSIFSVTNTNDLDEEIRPEDSSSAWVPLQGASLDKKQAKKRFKLLVKEITLRTGLTF